MNVRPQFDAVWSEVPLGVCRDREHMVTVSVEIAIMTEIAPLHSAQDKLEKDLEEHLKLFV